MTDCPNADVRDLLPDLLHGRLDEETRARVEGHLDQCADCAAELALLRELRDSMRHHPAVDVGAVVAAIPAARPVRRSWVGWRIAAAVTVLVGGAGSLLVLRDGGTRYADSTRQQYMETPPVMVTPALPSPAETSATQKSAAARAPQSPVTEKAAVRVADVSTPRELAMGGSSMGDLSDRELDALLKAIDRLDAVPSTDVENAAITPLQPRRGMP
jgi:anti-sigma factor RsiW